MTYRKALVGIVDTLLEYADTRQIVLERVEQYAGKNKAIKLDPQAAQETVDDQASVQELTDFFNARIKERMPNAKPLIGRSFAQEVYDLCNGDLKILEDAIIITEDHNENKAPVISAAAFVKAVLRQHSADDLRLQAKAILEERSRNPQEEDGIFGNAEERSKKLAEKVRSAQQGESIAERLARLKAGETGGASG